MVYKSINNMVSLIKNNLDKISDNVDLVVGNPRSGILPANIISLLKNISYCDLEALYEDKICKSGFTKNVVLKKPSECNNILIVDDSSYSGKSIQYIKDNIPDSLKDKCKILIIYANTNTKDLCDIYFELIDKARIFEWNLFHHDYLKYAGIELNVIYKNIFIITPTKCINTIIINKTDNKENIIKLLNANNIKFNKVEYKENVENIEFIIGLNNNIYINKKIDVIDYENAIYYRNKE